MKNLIYICFLTLLSYNLQAQKNCNCEVLLKTTGVHCVYNKPLYISKVIYKINNDTIKENYFTIVLYKITNRWAYISAYSPDTTINKKGWIRKNRLGILTSEYPVLYKEPDRNSKKIQIEYYNFNYLAILDCKNDWIKVRYSKGRNVYIGWLPPDNQCANPYTTCN